MLFVTHVDFKDNYISQSRITESYCICLFNLIESTKTLSESWIQIFLPQQYEARNQLQEKKKKKKKKGKKDKPMEAK